MDTPACANAKDAADYAVAVWLTHLHTSLNGGAGALIDAGNNRRRIVVTWMDPVTDRHNGVATPVKDANCAQAPSLQLADVGGIRCFVLDFTL